MPKTIKNLLLNYRDSIGALLVALKHPHVPMHSKMLIIIALAYALSPIDIIPDFIPILGYLDDAVIVPFLFYVAIHSIPQSVFYQCKQQAKKAFNKSIVFMVLGLLLAVLFWGFMALLLFILIKTILRIVAV